MENKTGIPTETEGITLSLNRLWRVLRDHFLWVLLAAIVCGAAGFAYASYMIKPVYTASTKVMVSSKSGGSTDISTMIRLVNSYVELLNSRDFYGQIADRLGSGYTAALVGSAVNYNIKEDSEVFRVSVTTGSAESCRRIIDELVLCMPGRIEETFSNVSMRIVESPGNPKMSAANRVKYAAAGLAGGAALCYGIFLLLEFFDVRCKEANAVASRYGFPLLGSIPSIPPAPKKKDQDASVKQKS